MHWILSWAQVLVCRLYEFTFDPRTWISKLVVVGRSHCRLESQPKYGMASGWRHRVARAEDSSPPGGRTPPTDKVFTLVHAVQTMFLATRPNVKACFATS